MAIQLNQGLLGALANPAIADIAGSFNRGQETRRIRDEREQQKLDKKQIGEILGATLGGKLGKLGSSNPETALALAKGLGIPTDEKGRLQAFVGAVQVATSIANGAGPREAAQYLAEVIDRNNQLGIPSPKLEGMVKHLVDNPQEGLEGLNLMTNSLAEQGLIKLPGRKEQQPQINVLRKSISDVTKDQKKIDAAFRKIKKAGAKATAAGDMSLIFSFMKILDPGSTVREGEFATAQSAAGVPERVLNLYNRALDGTRLGPDQRKDFLSQAGLLSEAQRESADLSIENILQQADQDEIGRERVFGKSRLSDFNKRAESRIQPIAPIEETVAPPQQAPTIKAAGELTDEELEAELRGLGG